MSPPESFASLRSYFAVIHKHVIHKHIECNDGNSFIRGSKSAVAYRNPKPIEFKKVGTSPASGNIVSSHAENFLLDL